MCAMIPVRSNRQNEPAHSATGPPPVRGSRGAARVSFDRSLPSRRRVVAIHAFAGKRGPSGRRADDGAFSEIADNSCSPRRRMILFKRDGYDR